jgi:hypothetical protein
MKIEYSCGSEVYLEKHINNMKLNLQISEKEDIQRAINRLKRNKLKVHDISSEETIKILDSCARLWLDRDYSKRHIEVIANLTNQSPQLVTYELESCMQALLKENIYTTIKEELGHLDILDNWVETSYGYVHRQPRGLAFHNISGNAFVVIPVSISMGLLSKNCNLIKVSGDEPYFANAFYKSLCEIDESIKERLSIVYFDSSKSDIYEEIVKESDCVIHWGGEYSGRIMKELCARYDTHIVMHGAKISFEVIESIPDIDYNANLVARDIIAWEQKACLSPRIVFINRDVDYEKFSQSLAEALNTLSKELPKSYLNTWNSVKAIQDRQFCTLKYGLNKGIKVYSSENADYTVLLNEDMPDKVDLDRCFYRFIFVCPYSDKMQVYSYVEDNLKDYLQTMGYLGDDEAFIEKMTLLGVSIVTKPGEMSLHQPGTSHDGLHNLDEMTFIVSRQL